MISAKLVNLNLLKIISVYDVTGKILSRDSNYFVDGQVTKNVDSSVRTREVIITSVLQ